MENKLSRVLSINHRLCSKGKVKKFVLTRDERHIITVSETFITILASYVGLYFLAGPSTLQHFVFT
jgi:hypothetical protein